MFVLKLSGIQIIFHFRVGWSGMKCFWWYLNEPVIWLDTQKKIVFIWLPFKNMTYEMKENTFVFTIWRKKVPFNDKFVNCMFCHP